MEIDLWGLCVFLTGIIGIFATKHFRHKRDLSFWSRASPFRRAYSVFFPYTSPGFAVIGFVLSVGGSAGRHGTFVDYLLLSILFIGLALIAIGLLLTFWPPIPRWSLPRWVREYEDEYGKF